MTVLPNSDDVVTHANATCTVTNGPDTIRDRTDVVYDANSNVTQLTDNNGTVIANTYDDANRLDRQDRTLATGIVRNVSRSLRQRRTKNSIGACRDWFRGW